MTTRSKRNLSALKILRTRFLDLSQRELASEIGVTHGYIAQIESSGGGMGKDSSLALAERFRKEMRRAQITLEDLQRGSAGLA